MFIRFYLAAISLAVAFATPALAAEKPNVVASIRPVHSLVAAVMGDAGAPALIVTDAGSPHNFVLKPSAARALERAHIVFWVGPGLETFLKMPVENLSRNAVSVELGSDMAMTLLPVRGEYDVHGHGKSEHQMDLHIWLDPKNAIAMTRRIARELASIDHTRGDDFRRNADKTIKRLESLTSEIETVLAPVRGARFAVHHDSFQYFENRFGLNYTGALLMDLQAGASLKRISHLAKKLAQDGTKCIFAEPQFNSKLAKKLAKSAGASLGILDPMGVAFTPGTELYFEMMESNALAFKRCLSD
ncbi:MAG: zinc ABC transporter substrate-binding protein [Hyphomicrobiales bacterium]